MNKLKPDLDACSNVKKWCIYLFGRDITQTYYTNNMVRGEQV